MPQPHFFTNGPIHAEEQFFDRDREAAEILRLLKRDQNVSIVGPRRIGKSSLLHHISNPTVFKAHDLTKSRHRFVHLCCRDLEDLSPSEYRAEIARRAQREIPEVTFLFPSDASRSTVISEQVRRFFRAVDKAERRCIIMLDHLEYLVGNPRLDHTFLEGLRALNAMHQVVYVVASVKPLSQLEETWMNQRFDTSPFFTIFYQYNLGAFNQEESLAFLRQWFKTASLPVPDEAVSLILSWAEGHPYHLQCAGDFTIRMLSDSPGDWNEGLRQRLEGHLATLKRRFAAMR